MLIKRGILHPNVFAHAYDYALLNLGKPQLYGFEAEYDLGTKKIMITSWVEHPPIDNKRGVNNRTGHQFCRLLRYNVVN